MAKTIGVTLSERISAGLVVDHKLVGPVWRFPEEHEEEDDAKLKSDKELDLGPQFSLKEQLEKDKVL